MSDAHDRSIAVFAKALSVCRGMLYSARTGDASVEEIERILESTGEDGITALIGAAACSRAATLADDLPKADKDALLGISDNG
jgi:hypothetical protein